MTVQLKQAFLTVFFLAAVANPLFAQAKKPGGGGEGTPLPALPNVRYLVDVIPIPDTAVYVNQINNAGVVVRDMSNQAFLYDHPANRLYDLNTDDDLQPVRDQLAVLFGPEWFFNSAIGANDHGQVVLGIYRSADGSGDCFLCNPRTGGTAVPSLILRVSAAFGQGAPHPVSFSAAVLFVIEGLNNVLA